MALNYMHADVETLRTNILPNNIQCHQATPNGTLEVTVPEYGSINKINLRINLEGGLGEALFQPIGFSRPNSYCEGTPFTPPRNNQKSLEYIDNKKHYQDKEQWETDTIRRAVVAYEFSAKVMKQTAYIVDDGQKMVIPNLLAFNRTEDKTAEEFLENSSVKDMGFNIIEYELEEYRDTSVGTSIVL